MPLPHESHHLPTAVIEPLMKVNVRYKHICEALIFTRSSTFRLRLTEAHFRVKAAVVRLRQKVRSRNRRGPAGRGRPQAARWPALNSHEGLQACLESASRRRQRSPEILGTGHRPDPLREDPPPANVEHKHLRPDRPDDGRPGRPTRRGPRSAGGRLLAPLPADGLPTWSVADRRSADHQPRPTSSFRTWPSMRLRPCPVGRRRGCSSVVAPHLRDRSWFGPPTRRRTAERPLSASG
jgi:hypothetical protein